MKEILRQNIINRLGPDVQGLETVLDCFSELSVKRNSFLLEQGSFCNKVYFVVKGCLQVFVYDNEMNETTRDIFVEGDWCSELISFGKGIPSKENIKAIENTDVLYLKKEDFQKFITTIPHFDLAHKQILDELYENSVNRINSFVSMSALERIQWLMQNRPHLMTRVSSKLIASYLGIHKDVFSRLKAKL